MAENIRIGIVQLTATQDRDRNLEHARELMARAVDKGASLLALPENFSYMAADNSKVSMGEDLESGASVTFLREFAREHSVALVGGTVPLKVNNPNKVANACLVIAPNGDIVARYDKIHMFDVQVDDRDAYVESAYIEAGGEIVVAELFGVPMGITVCYDVRFPELYRTLALSGARVLFVPAAFTVPTGRDHWEVLLRARAIENSCYVAAIGQVGHHYGDRHTYGHSMLIDPWGRIVAEAGGEDPEVLVADVDLAVLEETRVRVPSLANIRRDVFQLPGD